MLLLLFNVQPEITDLFLLGLNVTVPNYLCLQLVILVIEDYALSHVDNRIVLSLVFSNQRDLDAHKAKHLAMFQVIICHLLLGLSRNCRESKLWRERAKREEAETIFLVLKRFIDLSIFTMSSGPSHECLYSNPSGTILFNIISMSSLED